MKTLKREICGADIKGEEWLAAAKAKFDATQMKHGVVY